MRVAAAVTASRAATSSPVSPQSARAPPVSSSNRLTAARQRGYSAIRSATTRRTSGSVRSASARVNSRGVGTALIGHSSLVTRNWWLLPNDVHPRHLLGVADEPHHVAAFVHHGDR